MSGALSLRRIPLKNIGAHPVRAAILAFLALAQAACLLAGLVMADGMRSELALAEERLGADLVIYPTACLNQVEQKRLVMIGTPVRCHQGRSALDRTRYNPDIAEITYQLYVADTLPTGETLWIVGFDPATDFALSPWMERGTSRELAPGTIAAGAKVAQGEDGTVPLFGTPRAVSSRLAETGTELDDAVFVSMDTLESIIGDAVEAGAGEYASVPPGRDYSAALVRVSDAESVQSVTNWINLYVRKVTAVRSDEALVDTASSISSQRGVTIGVLGASWLLLLIALIVAQFTLMNEREAEVYVWRSGGASRGAIARVMTGESALIHLVGACGGVLIAAALPLVAGTPVGGASSVARVLSFAGVAIVVVVAAGVVGTRLALRRVSAIPQGQKLVPA